MNLALLGHDCIDIDLGLSTASEQRLQALIERAESWATPYPARGCFIPEPPELVRCRACATFHGISPSALSALGLTTHWRLYLRILWQSHGHTFASSTAFPFKLVLVYAVPHVLP